MKMGIVLPIMHVIMNLSVNPACHLDSGNTNSAAGSFVYILSAMEASVETICPFDWNFYLFFQCSVFAYY